MTLGSVCSSEAPLGGAIYASKNVSALMILSLFALFSVYVEKTHLIRAKVPILRFREKGR